MVDVTTNAGAPINALQMPENPLKEKWVKLYPPIPKPEYSQVCDGYSCMYCGRCPCGELWKVPEEDREVWEEYQAKLHEYLQATGVL